MAGKWQYAEVHGQSEVRDGSEGESEGAMIPSLESGESTLARLNSKGHSCGWASFAFTALEASYVFKRLTLLRYETYVYLLSSSLDI